MWFTRWSGSSSLTFWCPELSCFTYKILFTLLFFFGLFAPNVIVDVFSTVKISINAIVYSKPGLHLPLITHSFINTLADNPMCHRNFLFSSGRCKRWVLFIGGASIVSTASLIVREKQMDNCKNDAFGCQLCISKAFCIFSCLANVFRGINWAPPGGSIVPCTNLSILQAKPGQQTPWTGLFFTQQTQNTGAYCTDFLTG